MTRRWLTRTAPVKFPACLSPAEREAVEAVIRLEHPKLAARELGIGLATIRTQLQLAREKAGVKTMAGLAVAYVRAGMP